jgi:hypothetical protein
MIAARAGRTFSGSASFHDSVRYVARIGELKADQEPALAVWSENVLSLETASLEMERLAAQSRTAEPLYFFTASWSPGEKPTIEQAREAAKAYTEALGFEGLQAVWSLQNDGKARLYHLHAVFNLVDPVTKTARSTWREGMKVREASRRVEFEQGWERADNRTKREQAREASERGLTISELRALERPASILAALTTHEVAFSLADAQAAVMERVKDKEQWKPTLDAVMASAVPLRHKTTSEERFTTAAVLRAHEDLDKALRGLADDRIGEVCNVADRFRFQRGLTDDQKRAFLYATLPGGRLRTITGVPGAGKTRLVNAIAAAYRAGGYNVQAVSVANSAVEVLRADTTVSARSVAAELYQWSQGRERVGPGDLLIVDEASTLGTEWARDLIGEAQARGAVILLTGDHRQFQAVAYGNALGQAQAIEPGVDMQTTLRQKAEWQARASEDLRAGRIREGLDAYNRNGLIHAHATQADARAAVVAEWKTIERGGVGHDAVECGIEVMTNDERIELNALARRAHDDLGRLSGPEVFLETADGRTPYRAGDRVIVRETIREAGLHNGSVATVKRVAGSVLFVERRDGQTVPIDTRQFPGVQHGYAHTEYREQGSTRYADLQLVTQHVSQRGLVVGMTRHTHRYGMHYSAEKVGTFEDLVKLGERSRDKVSLDDFEPILKPAQRAREQSFARARGIAAAQQAERQAAERAVAEAAARAEAERAAQLAAWKADPDWRGFELRRAHYAKHGIAYSDDEFPTFKAYAQADRQRAVEQSMKPEQSIKQTPHKGMRR